jgi:hypothetical protein
LALGYLAGEFMDGEKELSKALYYSSVSVYCGYGLWQVSKSKYFHISKSRKKILPAFLVRMKQFTEKYFKF